MPDAMPNLAKNDQKSDTLTEMYLPSSMTDEDFHGFAELNINNLLSVLEKYNVKEKKIVLAQALLETGYFFKPSLHGKSQSLWPSSSQRWQLLHIQ